MSVAFGGHPEQQVVGDRSAHRAEHLIGIVIADIGVEFGGKILGRSPGDVVDRAAECAASVEGALWSFDDLDPLDIEQALILERAAAGADDRFAGDVEAVHQDGDAGPSALDIEAADRGPCVDMRNAFVIGEAGRQRGDIRQGLYAELLDLLGADRT